MFSPPTLFVDARCYLGESPLWDYRVQTLYWVDILGDALHCAHIHAPTDEKPPETSRFALPTGSAPGFCALTAIPGVLLVGTVEGLFYFKWNEGVFSPSLLSAAQEKALFLKGTPSDGVLFRFNDSQVCPDSGSLFAGIAQVDEERLVGRGALFRLDPSIERFEEGVFAGLPSGIRAVALVRPNTTVSNGMGWGPPQNEPGGGKSPRIMVHVDSPTRTLSRLEHMITSDTTCTSAMCESLVDTTPWGGYPDGLAVDVHSRVYVACIFAGVVVVTKPLIVLLAGGVASSANAVGGEKVDLLERIAIPDPNPTSCCIGGAHMDTLFITTARGVFVDAAAANTLPGAGGVYTVKLDGSVGQQCGIWGA